MLVLVERGECPVKIAAVCVLTIVLVFLQACATPGQRNEAVAEYREPEIVCKNEAPAGSRIKRRVCHEHGGPSGLERDRTFGRLHDLPMDRASID